MKTKAEEILQILLNEFDPESKLIDTAFIRLTFDDYLDSPIKLGDIRKALKKIIKEDQNG